MDKHTWNISIIMEHHSSIKRTKKRGKLLIDESQKHFTEQKKPDTSSNYVIQFLCNSKKGKTNIYFQKANQRLPGARGR